MWSCRWSVFVFFFFSSERINTDKIVLDNTAYKLPPLQWPQHSRNYDQETCIWDTDYPLKNILLSGVSVERPTFYLNVTKPWTLHYFFLLSIPVNTQSKLLARSHWGLQSPYTSGDFCFPLLSQGAVIVSNPTTQLSKSFANLILKGGKKKKHSKTFKGKSKEKKSP